MKRILVLAATFLIAATVYAQPSNPQIRDSATDPTGVACTAAAPILRYTTGNVYFGCGPGNVYAPLGGSGSGTVSLSAFFSNSGAAISAASTCGVAQSSGTIVAFTLMGDGTTGNATVDITTESFAQWLAGTAPTSITNGHPLSFSSAKGITSTSFTGWTTTTIVAGQVYCFSLTSPSLILTLTATSVY